MAVNRFIVVMRLLGMKGSDSDATYRPSAEQASVPCLVVSSRSSRALLPPYLCCSCQYASATVLDSGGDSLDATVLCMQG